MKEKVARVISYLRAIGWGLPVNIVYRADEKELRKIISDERKFRGKIE